MRTFLHVILWLVMVVCFIASFVAMHLVVAWRKPGLPDSPAWWQSSFNYVFYPSHLTPAGRLARRCFFLGTAGWLFAVLLDGLLGYE